MVSTNHTYLFNRLFILSLIYNCIANVVRRYAILGHKMIYYYSVTNILQLPSFSPRNQIIEIFYEWTNVLEVCFASEKSWDWISAFSTWKHTKCLQYSCMPTTFLTVYRNDFYSKGIKYCSRSENKTLDDTQ